MSNKDKEFYDYSVKNLQDLSFIDYILPYARNWIDDRSNFPREGMKVLELGAGSCVTGLLLSQVPQVSQVFEADISAAKMQNVAPLVQQRLGGDLAKLSFHETNFNDAFPFEDKSFDLVVMDAALHHSRNIWTTLSEIRRVLKDDGKFIAQREAYTSPWTNRITFRRMLASEEVKNGVSENAYLPAQYDYYLRANGFRPRFAPVYEHIWFRMFFFLNGLAFSKYNIISSVDTGSD